MRAAKLRTCMAETTTNGLMCRVPSKLPLFRVQAAPEAFAPLARGKMSHHRTKELPPRTATIAGFKADGKIDAASAQVLDRPLVRVQDDHFQVLQSVTIASHILEDLVHVDVDENLTHEIPATTVSHLPTFDRLVNGVQGSPLEGKALAVGGLSLGSPVQGALMAGSDGEHAVGVPAQGEPVPSSVLTVFRLARHVHMAAERPLDAQQDGPSTPRAFAAGLGLMAALASPFTLAAEMLTGVRSPTETTPSGADAVPPTANPSLPSQAATAPTASTTLSLLAQLTAEAQQEQLLWQDMVQEVQAREHLLQSQLRLTKQRQVMSHYAVQRLADLHADAKAIAHMEHLLQFSQEIYMCGRQGNAEVVQQQEEFRMAGAARRQYMTGELTRIAGLANDIAAGSSTRLPPSLYDA